MSNVKIGDLVKYRDWYTGKRKSGIIVDESIQGEDFKFFYVVWEDESEWECYTEIECLNEPR